MFFLNHCDHFHKPQCWGVSDGFQIKELFMHEVKQDKDDGGCLC